MSWMQSIGTCEMKRVLQGIRDELAGVCQVSMECGSVVLIGLVQSRG
jgi:hypothetical protein